QGQGIGVMAVGAAAARVETVGQFVVRNAVERLPAHGFDQLGGFGGVAVGACAGLVALGDAACLLLVDQRIVVAALLIMVDGESVSSPQPRHGRIFLQFAVGGRTAVGRGSIVLFSPAERVILCREVLT